jgi:hypothetical protein
MFIAEMYEYGADNDCVGVDGIDSCMGVFVLYDNRLFAIHQPNNDEAKNKLGRDKFIAYFNTDNPSYASGAKIYAVLNGNSRGKDAEAELREYQRSLRADEAKLVRISGYAGNSLAIVCERNGSTGNFDLKCKKASEAGWMSRLGKERSDYYQKDIGGHAYGVSSTAGWASVVDPGNAQIITLGAPLMDDMSLLKSKNKCSIM